MKEIVPGSRIKFLDGDADPIVGIVNGSPFLLVSDQRNGERFVYVPVHVPTGNRNVLVDFENIMRVLP